MKRTAVDELVARAEEVLRTKRGQGDRSVCLTRLACAVNAVKREALASRVEVSNPAMAEAIRAGRRA